MFAGFTEGYCLGVSSGIVENYQDVFMSPTRLEKGPYKVHAYPLKGHLNYCHWDQGTWKRSLRSGLLTNWTALTEPSDFCIHTWPMEVVPEPLEGVGCPQVPSHWF